MSTGVAGSYDGEGPNVVGGAGNPAPIAISPDAQATGPNPTPSGQGKMVLVAADRRRRLRVSSEGARAETPINVAANDQVLANYSRGVYISGAGTLVCRLVDAQTDSTFTNLIAGGLYPFCIALVRKSGTTATGNLLY